MYGGNVDAIWSASAAHARLSGLYLCIGRLLRRIRPIVSISAHFVTALTHESRRFLADPAPADHFVAKYELRLARRVL